MKKLRNFSFCILVLLFFVFTFAPTAHAYKTEHLERLKKTYDCPKCDLGGVYLRKAKLRGADLTGANLRGAELGGVFLTGADLTNADLRGADLTGADLRGANLTNADLRKADLRNADLTSANLTGANLTRAILFRVLTSFAKFCNTKTFFGINNSGCKDLWKIP